MFAKEIEKRKIMNFFKIVYLVINFCCAVGKGVVLILQKKNCIIYSATKVVKKCSRYIISIVK